MGVGLGGRKVPKKCHVLLECPKKVRGKEEYVNRMYCRELYELKMENGQL
jgi:hypothetical protein